MEEKLSVGGQAVLEGVMMRGPTSMVIAVRRPDGEIIVKDDQWVPLAERNSWFKKPLIRGAVNMAEALINGMQALSFSAEVAIDAEEEATRGERSDEAPAGDKPPGGEALTKGAVAMSMLSAFALGAVMFIYIPHWGASLLLNLIEGKPLLTEGDVSSPLFHLVVGTIKMTVFVTYISLISLMPDIRRVFQYHGAEHKSIHTYEAGEELTVENARKWPLQHPRCGTSFLVFVILISIGFFAAVFPFLPMPEALSGWKLNLLQASIKLPLMLPIAGLSYEFIKWAGKKKSNPLMMAISKPGLWVQNLTTREPDDEQLRVALVSLKRALEHEGALEAPEYERCTFVSANDTPDTVAQAS